MILAILFFLFLYLLHSGRCPAIVARVWFSFLLGIAVVVCFVVTAPVHALAARGVVSRRRSESIACLSCSVMMGTFLPWLSPHVQLKFMEGSLDLRSIDLRSAVCATHASFFDMFVFLWICPFSHMRNAKSFAKKALWKMPVMGRVIAACGHLPVYFTTSDRESFAVDKEKQAKVAEDAEKFLANGGSLCFFPEGALNKNPETLKDFRHGSFNMLLRHNTPIIYLVSYGCHEVWPLSNGGIPGFPANVYVYVGKYDYDKNATAAEVAEGLRKTMQGHVDDILARRKSEGYIPSCRPSQ